jgi:hypothetical protein
LPAALHLDRDLVPIDGAGPVASCDQQVWAIAVAGMPSSVRRLVKEFLVFDADNAAAGSDGAIGDVASAGSDATWWRMSLARNGWTDLDIAMTAYHLVRLRPGQPGPRGVHRGRADGRQGQARVVRPRVLELHPHGDRVLPPAAPVFTR